MIYAIFTLAWLISVLAWFGTIVEMVLYFRFVASVYALGIRVLDQDVDLPTPAVPIGATLLTRGGKARLVSAQECLFRRRHSLFRFELQSPIAIKGIIRWDAGRAHVVGRLSLGPTVFVGACMVGWTVGGLGLAPQGPIWVLGFVGLGWVVVAGSAWFAVWDGRRRARSILNELPDQLRATSA